MIFSNDLFNLDLGKMTAKEKDLFFFILEELARNKNNEFEMSFLELKKTLGLYKTSHERIINAIRKMCKRFQMTAQEIETEEGFEYFNVFEGQKINLKDEMFKITLKNEFRKFIDVDTSKKGKEQKGYTVVDDMRELYSIQSVYSKDIYLLLKRWSSTAKLEIEIEDFRETLKVPVTYKMHHIDQKILEICKKDLKEFFPGLTIEKIKSGRKVVKIIFTWQRSDKKKINKEFGQPQMQVASGSKKKFDKDLALEQTARAEAEVQELKLKENNIIEIIESLKEKKEIVNDKPFISESEFENMYQEWLKLQGVQDNKLTKRGYRLQIQGQYQILENKKAL